MCRVAGQRRCIDAVHHRPPVARRRRPAARWPRGRREGTRGRAAPDRAAPTPSERCGRPDSRAPNRWSGRCRCSDTPRVPRCSYPAATCCRSTAMRSNRYADLLATFIRLAPRSCPHRTLAPNPPWVAWDHGQGGVWPAPDDRDDDLNAPSGDGVAGRDRNPDPATAAPDGAGPDGRRTRRLGGPEPALARPGAVGRARLGQRRTGAGSRSSSAWPHRSGPAAPSHVPRPSTSRRRSSRRTSESPDAAGRSDEIEASWAAGLWVYAFNTKKASLDGVPWLTGDRSLEAATARRRLRVAGPEQPDPAGDPRSTAACCAPWHPSVRSPRTAVRPSAAATARTTASLARPSTAGALTDTISASPYGPG